MQDSEEGVYQNDHRSWFYLDVSLKAALSSLGRDCNTSIPIVDACVGRRQTGSESHRVVGIKCEGMEDFGFIYCKKQGVASMGNMLDPDDSDDLEFEYDYYFDVSLASTRIIY